MPCMQVINGKAANPSTTLTAWTMATGDSATVKSFPFGSNAWIVAAWAQEATIGLLRVTSPRLHDVNQGLRIRVPSTSPRNLVFDGFKTRLYPQDVMTLNMTGGASETDCQALLIYYEDLPGNVQNLHRWSEIQGRVMHYAGMEVSPVSSGTAGNYGTARALNADFDNWKRGYDYAILGYETDAAACSIGISGPDTAQTRIGGPAPVEPLVTRNWFVRLDEELGFPCIPVIQAVNIGATNIDVVSTTTTTTTDVTLIVAQLSTPGAPS